jgi:hypothetical protein
MPAKELDDGPKSVWWDLESWHNPPDRAIRVKEKESNVYLSAKLVMEKSSWIKRKH